MEHMATRKQVKGPAHDIKRANSASILDRNYSITGVV